MARKERRRTFAVGQAARALGVPPRRLEGWVERGVLTPALSATGTGTRRRFTWGDLVKAAILVELQSLLGANLRPGTVGAYLADWKEGDLEWMFIDGPPHPERPGVLLFSSTAPGVVAFNPQPVEHLEGHTRRHGVTIVVNVDLIQDRLRRTLGLSR
jgi:DNA-binding transcriptional MerR regulator